jgi:hypothetical protein
MKLMSHVEIRELADAHKLDALEAELPPFDDFTTHASGWLRRGVAEGFFRACEIIDEKGPVATLVYAQVCDPIRVLHGQGACSHRKHADVTPYILHALEKLGRDLGFDAVEFNTRRIGLVEKSVKIGWHLHSVTARKSLKS